MQEVEASLKASEGMEVPLRGVGVCETVGWESVGWV